MKRRTTAFKALFFISAVLTVVVFVVFHVKVLAEYGVQQLFLSMALEIIVAVVLLKPFFIGRDNVPRDR